jgi:hypothetical protein
MANRVIALVEHPATRQAGAEEVVTLRRTA